MNLFDPMLLIGIAVGVALAGVVGLVLRLRPQSPVPAATPGPVEAPETPPARDDRDALIRAYDLTSDPGERSRLLDRLGLLGVRAIGAAGHIDPAIHRVVEVVDLADLRAGAWVGEVVRPGWADADGVVRPADVVAYQRSI